MAFVRMTYTPATGLKDTTAFPTTPASEDAARKQIQDMLDQVTVKVNALMTALEDDTSGSSGAENVGSKAIAGVEVSAGVSAVTVHDQIVAVKAIADSASAGVLTAGSISDSNMFGSAVVPLSAMAANSVDSDQYVDGSIDHAHLATDAVDGTNIADDSVDSEHIVAGAIDTEHYANLSVTEGKVAAGAITKTKLGAGALAWTAILTDTDISASGPVTINSMAGYNEALIQIKAATGTGTYIKGSIIVPLQSSGIPTPAYMSIMTKQKISGSYEVLYRNIQFTSATVVDCLSSIDEESEYLSIFAR